MRIRPTRMFTRGVWPPSTPDVDTTLKGDIERELSRFIGELNKRVSELEQWVRDFRDRRESRSVVTINAAYTVTSGNLVLLVNAASGAVNVILSGSAPISGQTVTVVKTDATANAVNFAGDPLNAVPGTVPLNVQWQSVSITFVGGYWVVV